MCGSGRFLIPLLKRGFDIDGVDASPHMLQACRDHCQRLGLTPFDGESAVTIPLARYDDDHLARLVIGGFFHGTVWIEDRARSGELLPMACFDDLPGQERRPIRRHCAFLEWWLHDT